MLPSPDDPSLAKGGGLTTNTAPNKGNLIAEKKKLELARSGYELLDKKRNILIRELMRLVNDASELKKQTAKAYSDAYAALMRANVYGGRRDRIIRSIPEDDSVTVRPRSVMGVEIPTVSVGATDPSFPPYDPHSTDSYFDGAYVEFVRVKRLAARSAMVENGVRRLAEAIRTTTVRAEALKNVIIPEAEAAVREISAVLEEREREEFSRMKVIKNRKAKDGGDQNKG